MRLWRSFIWLVTNEWLLLFLLLCGGTYGVLTIAPWVSNQLWPPPEFVDSAKEGPGGTAEPEPTDGGGKEGAERTSADSPAAETIPVTPQLPVLPTSKAGSHPSPPPAFQQP